MPDVIEKDPLLRGTKRGDPGLLRAPEAIEPIWPFGAVLHAREGQRLADLDVEALKRIVASHRLLVLRGFEPVSAAELEDEARRYGDLLSWNFGNVLELVVHDKPQNYLFTEGNVPYHWDGAFAERVPALQVFQCVEAPEGDTGGETIFCDTLRVLERMGDEAERRLGDVEIAYSTDKLAHYGGAIRRKPLAPHPQTGAGTIRFAEPLNAETAQLNPLFIDVYKDGEKLTDDARDALFGWLIPKLYEPEVIYSHRWVPGDYLIADNHALLHGRAAFAKGGKRHLRRIHVL